MLCSRYDCSNCLGHDLYGEVALNCVRHFVMRGQRKSLLGTLALFATPFIIYQTIPSVKKRVNYTLYDWSTLNKDGEVNTSDALRILPLGM